MLKGDCGLTPLVVLTRIGLAIVLGGIVGMEREMHGRDAGFRTHILVCIGSALIMLVSMYGFPDSFGFDHGRLAAQVVSGIGFLGAGTIMREGSSVRGLTTAACLWVVAGVGLAVGAGYYVGAIAGALAAVLTLEVLDRVEHRFLTGGPWRIRVTALDRPGLLATISSVLSHHHADIRTVSITEGDKENYVTIHFTLEGIQQTHLTAVFGALQAIEGVSTVESR